MLSFQGTKCATGLPHQKLGLEVADNLSDLYTDCIRLPLPELEIFNILGDLDAICLARCSPRLPHPGSEVGTNIPDDFFSVSMTETIPDLFPRLL